MSSDTLDSEMAGVTSLNMWNVAMCVVFFLISNIVILFGPDIYIYAIISAILGINVYKQTSTHHIN